MCLNLLYQKKKKNQLLILRNTLMFSGVLIFMDPENPYLVIYAYLSQPLSKILWIFQNFNLDVYCFEPQKTKIWRNLIVHFRNINIKNVVSFHKEKKDKIIVLTYKKPKLEEILSSISGTLKFKNVVSFYKEKDDKEQATTNIAQYRQVITSISRRCFDGSRMLFCPSFYENVKNTWHKDLNGWILKLMF